MANNFEEKRAPAHCALRYASFPYLALLFLSFWKDNPSREDGYRRPQAGQGATRRAMVA